MPAKRTSLGTDALSQGLAQLRDNAGLSGARAAQRAGVGFSQSKISRWEAGKLIPSPDDVDRYAQALGASAAERRRLVAYAHDLHDQHKASTPGRITLRRAASYQQRVARIEADSARIATFHPLLIPGLLQTAEYMRALFGSRLTGNALDQAVAARVDRQQLLNDTSRTCTMILTHGAFGWRGGSLDDMVAQVEHIIDLSRRPNLHIGIIPWGTQATVFPVDGFNIYDERLVIVGTTTATAHITDPRDITQYITLLTDLTAMATFGDQARTIFAEIATAYKRRSSPSTGVIAPGLTAW